MNGLRLAACVAMVLALAAPSPAQESGRALAAARALALPVAVQGRIAAYETTWREATRNPSDAGVCQLVHEARALGPALFKALNPRIDKATAAQRESLANRIEALDQTLPGLVARDPREAQVAFALSWDFAQLGEGLAGPPAAKALLIAAGEVIGRHGQAGHVHDLGHETGCTDYGRALGPYARLATTWRGGPACLKDALRPTLRDTMEWLGDEVNFCQGETRARADAREAVRLLGNLTELGGPAAARRLAINMREGDLQFGLLDATALD